MQAEPQPRTVAAAQNGDPEAFAELVAQLTPWVYNMARRFVPNPEDAGDLSQEVFIRLHRGLPGYDPDRPFLPWFRRLLVRTALNFRRAMRPARRLPEEIASNPAGLSEPDRRLVEESVRTLPGEYRLAIALYYYEGLEVTEIARAMAVPAGTVKTWLFRARDLLRRRLAGRVEP